MHYGEFDRMRPKRLVFKAFGNPGVKEQTIIRAILATIFLDGSRK